MSTQNNEILAVLAKKAFIKPETVAPLSAFTADLSADHDAQYHTVEVLKISAGSAKNKEDGKAYESDSSTSTVAVQLAKRLYSETHMSDVMFQRMSDVARVDLFVAAASKVGKAMITELNTLVARATKTAEFTPSFAGVGAAKAAATAANIEGDLVLCLAPAQYDALVADPDVAKIAAIGGNNDVFAKGVIAQLHGLKVVRLPAAPTGTVGFLTSKSAIGIATRTTPLGKDDGQVITDEATGLSFTHKYRYDSDTAGVKVTTEILFGAALIDDAVIVKLTAKAE